MEGVHVPSTCVVRLPCRGTSALGCIWSICMHQANCAPMPVRSSLVSRLPPHTTFSERDRMTRDAQAHARECEHTTYSLLQCRCQAGKDLSCSALGTGAVELTGPLELEGHNIASEN